MNRKTRCLVWTNAVVLVFSFFLLGSCGLNEDQLKISALTHFKKGNLYFEQKRLAAAAEEYKRAIALNPDEDRFYYNLGLVYYSLSLYYQAIIEYQNAIERNPGFQEAWYNLALAFEKVDETEKAFMAYEKYQRISKNSEKSDPNSDESVTPVRSSE
ncbi:tetratricopeptide repeat protein [bacterium]|nr:tetratricopeptide repeat protein [bacterium]